MNYPKITVMIPTYNQEKYIGNCIEKALLIDYPNLEVVLSDDCSSDKTFKIAKEFESDHRFRAYRAENNQGRVNNYNILLNAYATGEWVINCDGDDYLLGTNFFMKSMEIYASHPEISMFYANRYVYNSSDNRYSPQYTYGKEGFIDGTLFFEKYFIRNHGLYHLSTLYKRSHAIEAEFYKSDIISSDIESLLKLTLGRTLYHSSDFIAVWRGHDENASRSDNYLERAENLKLIINVFDYYRRNNIPEKYLLDWKKRSLKARIVRTSNRFLSKGQYLNFFRFLKSVNRLERYAVFHAIIDFRLILTFLFPYNLFLRRKIRGLLRSNNNIGPISCENSNSGINSKSKEMK